jgi:threonine/homoserine/homoserine lactone efflux protein
MADSCYAAMAAFGLTAISTILLQYQFWFNIIGGLFLLYIGVQAFLKESIDIRSNTTTHTKGLWASFLSTAAITISSPATVLLFVSVFSIMGIDAKAEDKSLSAASLIVLGFFLGSMVWWVFVSYITSFFRSKLNKTAFSWVNKISGIIMCSFAVFAFLKAFEII